MTQTIYEELRASGCPIDNHESDLYVKSTPESRAIIERRQNDGESLSVSGFTSQTDQTPWLDLPFRFDPYWAKKC